MVGNSRTIAHIQGAVGSDSPLIGRIVDHFELRLGDIHGVDHWLKVYSNGIRLSGRTGANLNVIRWFALFHDSCRQSNGADIDHGPRAAAYALAHRAELDLSDNEMDMLIEAVSSHTKGCSMQADITVQTCLDADRLDLVRLGMKVRADLLYTEAAKEEVSQSDESMYRAIYFPKQLFCVNCGKRLTAFRPGRFRCPACRFLITIDKRAQVHY